MGMRTSHRKGTRMRPLLMHITLAAIAAAAVGPVGARVVSPAAAPPQGPPAGYYGYGNVYQPFPFPAPTPRDAYRDGLINRWQLEQLEGPLPPALQGSGPDGGRGGGRGGS